MNSYEVWVRRTLGVLRTQRISVSGLNFIPKTGAGVLAPNHLNWKDVFFLSALIPRQIHYVGTYELFDNKKCCEYVTDYILQRFGRGVKIPAKFLGSRLAGIISHRIKAVGAVPVKRGGSTKKMFESVKDSLRNGKLVCLFPEGGTGMVGKLKKFKKGLSKIVYDLWEEGYERIPVFPASIKGTNKFFLPKRHLSLKIGLPLHIEDYLEKSPRETLVRFTEHLWQAVYNLLFDDKELNHGFANKSS